MQENINGDCETQRKCVATGEVIPACGLVRFVRAPDGSVVPDLKRRLPGRGVWVKASYQAVSEAQKRKLFDRGFRAACRIEESLAATTGRLLEEQAMGYLALANKAGLVIQGFDKVEAALVRNKLAVLIGATDGAEDGRSKLKHKCTAPESKPAIIENFTSDQLGLALGRTNVIHAGMSGGGLTRKFVTAAKNISDYLPSSIESYKDKA